MYTIKQLCAKSGLSRSTLLYYDSLRLISPSARSQANYRLYSDDDMRRLERVCIYREAGVSLEEIGQILRLDENTERSVLEKTMEMLNRQARSIQEKQVKISALLQNNEDELDASFWLDKEFVVSALISADFSGDTLLKFHEILEGESREKHQKFLNLLGFTEAEMKYILKKLQTNEHREGTRK